MLSKEEMPIPTANKVNQFNYIIMSKICELLQVKPQSGNKVSHSNRKTRRRFLPNLKQISFHSKALGINLKLSIATSTLRTINKYGDIDNFLLNFRFNKLSSTGQSLRLQIKKKLTTA